MAHERQSRPDSGLDVQAKVLKTCQVVPSSLGNGSSAEHSLTWRKVQLTTGMPLSVEAAPSPGLHRAPDIVLLQGPRGVLFPVGDVSL